MESGQVDPWYPWYHEYDMGDNRGIMTKWFEHRVRSEPWTILAAVVAFGPHRLRDNSVLLYIHVCVCVCVVSEIKGQGHHMTKYGQKLSFEAGHPSLD